MKVIKENKEKTNESYSTYDIQNMIANGTFGIECDGMLEELGHALFQIKETDKLESFLTKYYRSAPEYIRYIKLVTELLYSAKKKG